MSYMTLTIVALFCIITTTITAAKCAPKSKILTPEFRENCTRVNIIMGITTSVVALIADIVILVLPLPVLIKLNLPLSQKISLIVVFLTGAM